MAEVQLHFLCLHKTTVHVLLLKVLLEVQYQEEHILKSPLWLNFEVWNVKIFAEIIS